MKIYEVFYNIRWFREPSELYTKRADAERRVTEIADMLITMYGEPVRKSADEDIGSVEIVWPRGTNRYVGMMPRELIGDS